MKGVILAGGFGTRLWPLTRVSNKHLLPVGRKPMIYYPMETLLKAGINEIMIVTGIDHVSDMVRTLGSGRDFNCSLTYKIQDEAGGIAHALMLAENFVGYDNVCVILGDNIFEDDISPYAYEFDNGSSDVHRGRCQLFAHHVEDPERFGVATIGENGQPIGIVEKPKNPESNFAVVGLYMYDPAVFDFIRTLEPSDRGELEITDVNNWHIKNGVADIEVLNGYWCDAGTFESLERATRLVLGK